MPTTPFATEHAELRASVRRLVDGPLEALAAEAETGGTPHAEVLARCAALGVFDLDDVFAEVAVAAELGRLRSTGLALVVLDGMLTTSLSLPRLDTAVARDASAAVTERGADADLSFVVGGQLAAQVLVLDQHVVVSLDGATVEALERPLSLRGSAPAGITVRGATYDKVEVSPRMLRRAELREAAAAVRAAERTWSDAVTYAQQREVFGRPVSKFQVNRHALAEAATKIKAAESLVHDTAFAVSRDPDADTAAARLYAGRVYAEVADRALQLHGGYGYTSDFDVQRAWRDARSLRAGDLTLRARLSARRLHQ